MGEIGTHTPSLGRECVYFSDRKIRLNKLICVSGKILGRERKKKNEGY